MVVLDAIAEDRSKVLMKLDEVNDPLDKMVGVEAVRTLLISDSMIFYSDERPRHLLYKYPIETMSDESITRV